MFKVCVVGLGPAGIGATYVLAHSPLARQTLCVDAGIEAVSKCCQLLRDNPCAAENPCQMISGIGGCSSVTSGKLSNYPAGTGLARILGSRLAAKQELVEAVRTFEHFLPLKEPDARYNTTAAKKLFGRLGFEYRYYPVYTFQQEHLAKAYQEIMEYVESTGVLISLRTMITDITFKNDHFRLVATSGDRRRVIEAEYVILAVGWLGQDLLRVLDARYSLTKNRHHLDVGVRLEFPTELYPDIDKYHRDLKLLFGDARTFCVCKGGKIVPYRYRDIYLLDGFMDTGHRTAFTNLSIRVRYKPSTRNLTVFNSIREKVLSLSKGVPIRQNLQAYFDPSKEPQKAEQNHAGSFSFWQWGDVNQCFPKDVSKDIRQAVEQFASKLLPREANEKASVFAPEVDCRLTFPVKPDFSVVPGLYMAGDCTGRFRGILQAFCSGGVCAKNIVNEKSGDK
jgi:uncharacterized FAD-dependent dehydrogenase